MNEALQVLKDRGFLAQCTDLKGLDDKMSLGPITFYVGCDPTGKSLHVGHIVPFFALKHLVQFGHKGIALIGGGTARIGDPSGKTQMRQMLSYDQIEINEKHIYDQLDKFLGFDGKNIIADNNKNWLCNLNYIDFLRDIGSCFSVNKMLSFEAYKQRLERGLSFIEFNYQLLQSYDFLCLHQKHGCSLQIGGDDQWGNITAGVDLIRRKLGGTTQLNQEHTVYGLTFPLITRSDGKKMGKTEKGALFLDKNLTSVFDFFQYWRNVDDKDVKKFFLLFTFLPIEQIQKIIQGDINTAKQRLAFEITSLIHGTQEAQTALNGALAAFSSQKDKTSAPSCTMPKAKIQNGISLIDLFFEAKLCATKSDARRLIQQGGAYVNGTSIKDVKATICKTDLDKDASVILKAGKKKFLRVVFA